MADKRQLKIKLLPNGEIQMETIGVKGAKCLNYVDLLQKLADVKILKQELTQEYYEQETAYHEEFQNIEERNS